MKAISTLIMLSLCAAWAIAGEVTGNLDRVALVSPPLNQADELSNRIAMHFALPEGAQNAEIIYAELNFPIDLSQAEYEGDAMLEFQAHNISSDWTEENPDCFAAMDDSSFYTYTINMANDRAVHMDITEFVRSLAGGDAENNGLILIPFKYDQDIFNLPSEIISPIRNSAQLRIIYE